MMMKISLMVLSFSYVTSALAQEWRPYKVVQNDQFGRLLLRNGAKLPIWGKHGSLKVALRKNPHIRNPNRIKPGEIVYLPYSVPLVPSVPPIPSETKESSPPPLAEAPAQTEQIIATKSTNSLSVGTHLSFWDRDVTEKKSGAHASLESNLITGLWLRPEININENWMFESLLSMKRITFASAGNMRLSEHAKVYLGAEAGVLRTDQSFQYGLGLTWDELPYVQKYVQDGIDLTTNRIFAGYVKGQWRFNPNMALGLRLKYIMSSVEGYSVGPYFNYDHKLGTGLTLLVNPFVTFDNVESERIRYEDRELGLRLGIQKQF